MRKKRVRTEEIDTIVTGILDAISYTSEIDVATLLGRSRRKKIVEWRHFAMEQIREKTRLPYHEIGKIFNRSHVAVIFALRK